MAGTDDGGTTGGSANGIGTERVDRLALWIALALAVTGVAFGLLPTTYGSYGETQYESPGSGNQDLTDEEKTQRDATFKNQTINLITAIVPYLAVAMAIGAGFAAGAVGSGNAREVAAGAAAGAVVGVTLFVFLSSAIAMQQWWSVGSGFGTSPRWLQWDTTIKNAILFAIPAAIAAPVAGVGGLHLRS